MQAPDDIRFLFDRALQLRDGGNIIEAERLLQQLVDSRAADAFFAHAAVQLGHLRQKLGRHADALETYERAMRAAPRDELASLSLFHALLDATNHAAAMAEAKRLLLLRESLGYRELLVESPRPLAAFPTELTALPAVTATRGACRELRAAFPAARAACRKLIAALPAELKACRGLLAEHAARQLREPPFSEGHTVRIHDHAPKIFRPADLATIAKDHRRTAPEIAVLYSDDATAEIPSDLLSYGTV